MVWCGLTGAILRTLSCAKTSKRRRRAGFYIAVKNTVVPPDKQFTWTTPLSSQKATQMASPADGTLFEFLLPWGCCVAPFHRLPHGFWTENVGSRFHLPVTVCNRKPSCSVPHRRQRITGDYLPWLLVCVCHHTWHPMGTEPAATKLDLKIQACNPNSECTRPQSFPFYFYFTVFRKIWAYRPA